MSMNKALGVSLILGGSLVIGLLIRQVLENEQQWKKFSTQHHCRITSQEPGSVIFVTNFMVSPNGQMTPYQSPMTIPGETTYTCDNGEQVRR